MKKQVAMVEWRKNLMLPEIEALRVALEQKERGCKMVEHELVLLYSLLRILIAFYF